MKKLIEKALVIELFEDFIAEFPKRLFEEVGRDTSSEFTAAEIAEIVCAQVRALKSGIELFPAVEQPMSAVEYERTRERRLKWCSARPCYKCEHFDDCAKVHEETPEYKVALVEKWAQEHPERSDEE